MSTYAIGDIQGCFDPLQRLLDKIKFDPSSDKLWFTGDLINRGPKSLESLRFIKSLADKDLVTAVLGNHDLAMLNIARGAEPYMASEHTFADILQAEDKEPLLRFLEQLPLIHHDAELGFTLVHAGLHPAWDLTLALSLSKEVEQVLQIERNDKTDSNLKYQFYKHHFGNTPHDWNENLRGFDRLRFIVNCFTRIRFCRPDGTLDFITKESSEHAPHGFLPWYKIENRKSKDLKILFGHWSTLQGKTGEKSVYALDTGCVWGNALTAMRLEDEQYFKVECR